MSDDFICPICKIKDQIEDGKVIHIKYENKNHHVMCCGKCSLKIDIKQRLTEEYYNLKKI